ncbi:MAG: 2-amino-4-hydroxy-6-hydroxymethyldihydropteridine diphosphokinase [Bacteroidaceae bacterium]|nr:2-amino-4-hydroxy-6-hydroxymethyldihydropteridine diphosphokinase [Bacteroidaceae bacterium]
MTLYLSLGSNQGDRRALLDEAVRLIGERVGEVQAVSRYLETEPWGFVSKYPFLNAAMRVATTLSPWDVLAITQTIERNLGRTRKSVAGIYHDRTIDIDLLMMGDIEMDETALVGGRIQRLTLPHPLMQKREFVMIPLREVLVQNV